MNPNPELIARLTTCAAALEHLSNHSGGDYAYYWHDRAAQCRSWGRLHESALSVRHLER